MNNLAPIPAALLSGTAAYLVGSIPFAVIVGRVTNGVDVRKHGSGNAGSTNVFRVLGWKPAVLVLCLDMLKGFLPVLLIPRLFSAEEMKTLILPLVVLVAVTIGHSLPLWAGFRGGKGVATSAGGILAMYFPVTPWCLGVFILVLATTRYVSAASLAAAWVLPTAYVFMSLIPENHRIDPILMIGFTIVALGVTVLHRDNIRRLVRGEEKALGGKNLQKAEK